MICGVQGWVSALAAVRVNRGRFSSASQQRAVHGQKSCPVPKWTIADGGPVQWTAGRAAVRTLVDPIKESEHCAKTLLVEGSGADGHRCSSLPKRRANSGAPWGWHGLVAFRLAGRPPSARLSRKGSRRTDGVQALDASGWRHTRALCHGQTLASRKPAPIWSQRSQAWADPFEPRCQIKVWPSTRPPGGTGTCHERAGAFHGIFAVPVA